MNKRQSKKQELQTQVDDLQTKVEKFRSNMNLNATIANQNQEITDEKFKNVNDNVGKIIKMQEDVVRTVSNNRLYILDIQKQLKYVNLNSIIHSIAIFTLAVALIWRW